MLPPPMPNEVEVSIFGGGYGESILVHPGNNEWIIIDSFRSPYTKRPVALEYLEKLNVNINEAVKLIVATHWHDDHVGGLSEIVDVCKNASFVTPGAISSKEFLNFLYADIDLKEKRYGNKELGVILEEYNQRNKTVVLATENKRILNRPFYEVYSLAPSDYSTLNAIKEIATLLPEEHKPRKAIPNPKVNNYLSEFYITYKLDFLFLILLQKIPYRPLSFHRHPIDFHVFLILLLEFPCFL